MKSKIKIVFLLLLVASLRFLLSDNSFREQIYTEEKLKKGFLYKLFISNEQKIDPFGSIEQYSKSKEDNYKKNTIAYYYFLYTTCSRVLLIGFLIFLLSLITGYIVYVKRKKTLATFDSVVGGFRAVPAIAWLPLLSGFGLIIGFKGIFLFLSIGVYPLICSQVLLAIKSTPEELFDTIHLFKISNFKAYWSILISSQETILAKGISYGLSHSFVLMLVYELFFQHEIGIMRIVDPLAVGVNKFDAIIMLALIASIGFLFNEIPNGLLLIRKSMRKSKSRYVINQISKIE